MDSTVVQTVSQMLDELGARFGSTGAHLWGELVKYEVVTAIAGLVLSVVLLPVMWKATTYCWARSADDYDWDIAAWLLSMVSVIVTVGICLSLPYLIGAIIAPEAAVIRGLLP